MKIQLKGNRKLLILGAVIMTILVVEAAVLIALTVAYGKEHKRTNIQESAEVQSVLSEIQSEEVKALFFSMFSLDSYEVDDFITYRGINTVMLEEALESGEEVLETLNLTGRKAVYQLGIPKGDGHDWEGKRVAFFDQSWRVIGIPLEGQEELIPLGWNKKVKVERYG